MWVIWAVWWAPRGPRLKQPTTAQTFPARLATAKRCPGHGKPSPNSKTEQQLKITKCLLLFSGSCYCCCCLNEPLKRTCYWELEERKPAWGDDAGSHSKRGTEMGRRNQVLQLKGLPGRHPESHLASARCTWQSVSRKRQTQKQIMNLRRVLISNLFRQQMILTPRSNFSIRSNPGCNFREIQGSVSQTPSKKPRAF